MGLLIIACIIGMIEMLIPLSLTIFEKKYGQYLKYLHIILNLIFIIVSLYFINFVPMYPHGPSLIWLAIPAWPSFLIFYALVYPRVLKDKRSLIITPIISGIYFIGSLVGLFTLIKDWNVV